MSNTEHSWFERLSHLLSREPHSQTQLIEILRDAQQRELIDRDALQMIEGVLAVSDKKVRDVMIPRTQMVAIEADMTPQDALPIIIQSQHSRFPVIDNILNNVVGVLLAKDLLPVVTTASKPALIRDFIRPATIIPDSKRLDILLKEFRQTRNHMAIVVDEYGSVSGLITIEDVLEEIVGDIEDEYDIDDTELSIKTIEDNTYLVNALTPVTDFNEHFHTHFSDEDFDTIGGLVLQQFGYLPKRNERTTLGNFEVTVVKATRRGIQALQFKQGSGIRDQGSIRRKTLK